MRAETPADAIAVLESLHGLEDSIVTDVTFADHFTTVIIELTYYWDESGRFVPKNEDEDRVRLTFRLVRRFVFETGLGKLSDERPELWNWGLDEVASVRARAAPSDAEVIAVEFATDWFRRILIDCHFLEAEVYRAS